MKNIPGNRLCLPYIPIAFVPTFRQLMWPATTVWMAGGGGGCAGAIGSHFKAAFVRLQHATEWLTELLATRWKHEGWRSLAVLTWCYLHKSSPGALSVCSLPPAALQPFAYAVDLCLLTGASVCHAMFFPRQTNSANAFSAAFSLWTETVQDTDPQTPLCFLYFSK